MSDNPFCRDFHNKESATASYFRKCEKSLAIMNLTCSGIHGLNRCKTNLKHSELSMNKDMTITV